MDFILDILLVLFCAVVILLCAAVILYVAWLVFWSIVGIVGAIYLGVKKNRYPTARKIKEVYPY